MSGVGGSSVEAAAFSDNSILRVGVLNKQVISHRSKRMTPRLRQSETPGNINNRLMVSGELEVDKGFQTCSLCPASTSLSSAGGGSRGGQSMKIARRRL